jgi:hypothetical protein
MSTRHQADNADSRYSSNDCQLTQPLALALALLPAPQPPPLLLQSMFRRIGSRSLFV